MHFSITPDVTRLVDEGIVAKDWNAGPNKGIVTDSVVVLVVREGNPKNIKGWDDLAKEGVGIVTPNPGSSGAARWNILAAWQHIIAGGGSEDDAKAYLAKVFANVKALPGSGRDATTAFQGGTGDVLISYENEAILARQNGEKIDYVVPDDTLKIENPAAVTENADPKAKAFLDFVLTKEGQEQYVSKGFRPLESVEGVDGRHRQGRQRPGEPVPDAEEAVHDRRRPRWLGRAHEEVLRREERHHHRSCWRSPASRDASTQHSRRERFEDAAPGPRPR